jgi:pimeloyl-ACP methyl ester carboxylesterase
VFEEIRIEIAGKSLVVLIDKDSGQPSRPPCFVVGLSSHYHDKFSKEFCSFYKLILVDFYWTDTQFSPEYIEALEIPALVDHLEQARAQLQDQLGDAYRKIFMLGHSAYGFITLDFALKYPNSLHGFINIASPLHFDNELSSQWQEEYINKNFAHPKLGGPTARWHAYHDEKTLLSKQIPDKTKQYFVSAYTSKSPLFFDNPAFWERRNNLLAKMWEAWRIPVFDRQTNTLRCKIRDVHMPMLLHYTEMIKGREAYTKLPEIKVQGLWVIALGDLRVSIYHLEDSRAGNLPKNIEFFHPLGSHWPMLAADADTREFDDKLIGWGSSLLESSCNNRPKMISKL